MTTPERDGVALALVGFALVAAAQSTNMVLARANAGDIPPFALAFVRWSLVALGLLPFVAKDIRAHAATLSKGWPVVAAGGFLGFFVCGAPVYVAAITSPAVNIGLIMALSPIVVLLISAAARIERIRLGQALGMMLALGGVSIILGRGRFETLRDVAFTPGDLILLVAMLAWSLYTVLQSRDLADVPFLARVCVFAAGGALMTAPFAVADMIATPARVFSARTLAVCVFAGLVPGILAYSGFAWLGGRFGSARTSLVMYMAPLMSALLAYLYIGEPPQWFHVAGGLLILGGLWLSLRK